VMYVFYRDGTIFYIPCVSPHSGLALFMTLNYWFVDNRVFGKSFNKLQFSFTSPSCNLAVSTFGFVVTLNNEFTCSNWEA
jgi:hypothetical protein